VNEQIDREADVREWLAYARADRQAANALFEVRLYSVCAFHCTTGCRETAQGGHRGPDGEAATLRYPVGVEVGYDETSAKRLLAHVESVFQWFTSQLNWNDE
jgi:hypothetical protein